VRVDYLPDSPPRQATKVIAAICRQHSQMDRTHYKPLLGMRKIVFSFSALSFSFQPERWAQVRCVVGFGRGENSLLFSRGVAADPLHCGFGRRSSSEKNVFGCLPGVSVEGDLARGPESRSEARV